MKLLTKEDMEILPFSMETFSKEQIAEDAIRRMLSHHTLDTIRLSDFTRGSLFTSSNVGHKILSKLLIRYAQDVYRQTGDMQKANDSWKDIIKIEPGYMSEGAMKAFTNEFTEYYENRITLTDADRSRKLEYEIRHTIIKDIINATGKKKRTYIKILKDSFADGILPSGINRRIYN